MNISLKVITRIKWKDKKGTVYLHNGRDPYQINQLLENILMSLYMVF